jgi:hypothetical protein
MHSSQNNVSLRFATLLLGLLASGFGPAIAVGQDALPRLDLGKVVERHQMIPMRDGKHLSAWM